MRLEAREGTRTWGGVLVRPASGLAWMAIGCGGVPLLVFDLARALLATAGAGTWA